MRPPFSFLFALVIASLASFSAKAQAPAPNLKDPDTLLAAAIAGNGLGDDLQPWHLKANYDVLDHRDKVIATGVFEEWWSAKDKWKRSYTGKHYTGTEYHLPEGSAHEGNPWSAVPWPEALIAAKLLAPIDPYHRSDAVESGPPNPSQGTAALELHPLRIGKSELPCVRLSKPHGTRNTEIGYCFEPGSIELRISGFALYTVLTKVGLFQGRFIGLETSVSANEHRLIDIHLVSLTSLRPENFPTLPPSVPLIATKDDALLSLSSSAFGGKKLSGDDPDYPEQEQRHAVQGTVIIGAVISEQGTVEDAQVLEAPNTALGDAALAAVHTWKYQPYLREGKPVKVKTTIDVVYNLGG